MREYLLNYTICVDFCLEHNKFRQNIFFYDKLYVIIIQSFFTLILNEGVYMKRKSVLRVWIIILVSISLLGIGLYASGIGELPDELAFLLGESSSQIHTEIVEEGSLEEGNLTLTLGFSGDEVAYAKMTTPSGQTEEKKPDELVIEEEQGVVRSFSLGESSDLLDELDGDEFALGESLPGKTLSGAFVFDADSYGEYQFELYNAENELVGVVPYDLRAAGDLTITFLEPKKPLNYRNTGWSFILNYQKKVVGEQEKVTLYLPPTGVLTAAPPNSPNNYTITTSSIYVPATLYPEASSQAWIDGGATIQKVEILFEAAVAADTSLSFSYNMQNINNIGPFMERAGADNEQNLPLKFIATAGKADGSVIYSTQVLDQTTSIIPDADGNPTPDNHSEPVVPVYDWAAASNKNSYINYNTTYPYYSIGAAQALGVGAWHYPVTNIKYYMPLYPGQTAPDPSSTYVDPVTGTTYKVNTYSSFNQISSAQGFNLSDSYSSELDLTEIKEGPVDAYYADRLVSYSYMGEDYGPVPFTKNSDLVQIPDATFLTGLGAVCYYNPPNHNGESAEKRVQGYTGDTVYFVYTNTNNQSISPYYKDMTFTYEFPYEVIPKTNRFTMVKKNSFTGPNAPTTEQTAPKGTYYVYGDPTPRNITFSVASNGADYTATYDGISADEHIQKVVISYDEYPPLTEYSITFVVDYATKDIDGNLLPLSYPVQIKESTVGTKIKQLNTDEPISDPYSRAYTKDLTLIRYEAEDSLLFGRTSEHGGETFASNVNLYAASWDYSMVFGQATIRRATVLSKTYPKLTIYFGADDTVSPADDRFISMANGVAVQNFSVVEAAIDDVKAYRRTNLNPVWQEIPREPNTLASNYGPITRWSAPLQDGEYVLETKLELINLNAEKLPYQALSGADNVAGKYINPVSTYNSGPVRFSLTIDSTKIRSFYQGSAEEVPVTEVTQVKYRVRAEVEGGAQHINPNEPVDPSVFRIDSYTQTLNLIPSGVYNYGENNTWAQYDGRITANGSTTSYNPAYQGSSFTFITASSYSNKGTLFDYKFTDGYKIRYYVQTSQYVDISGLLVYNDIWGSVDSRNFPTTLVEMKTLADDSKLYVFEFTATEPRCQYYLSGRIRPDTPAPATQPIILSSGWAFVGLEEQYLQDIDGKSYDQSFPYVTYNFPGQVAFPASWGIDQTDLITYYKNQSWSREIGLNVSSIGDISLFTDGLVSGIHNYYNKDNLGIDYSIVAQMGGVQQYEVVLGLGRKGETLETKLPTALDVSTVTSDYDVYLKRPVSAADLSGLVNPEVKYYTDEGLTNEVVIDDTTSAEVLKTIKFIHVYFENVSSTVASSFYVPVYTDYKKTETTPIYSYVSAKGRDFNSAEYSVSEAKPFTYNSFNLVSRFKMDTTETGTLSNTNIPTDLLTYRVYYDDGAGGEEMTYEVSTVTNGTLTAQVNDGVKRIELMINPQYQNKYMFTVPKKELVSENNNSDFPRPVTGSYTTSISIGDGPGEVPMSQITTYVPNLFDAGFIIIPTMSLEDIEVKVGDNVEKTLKVLRATDNGVPEQLSYYQVGVSYTPATQDKATIVEQINSANPDVYQKVLNITGEKKGTVDYKVTVTNRLGDVFTFDQTATQTTPKIKVVPDWIQVTGIAKNFKNTQQSILNTTDQFSVSIEVLDDSGVAETTGVVSGIGSTSIAVKVDDGLGNDVLILEKGMNHTIEEVNIPAGYLFDDIEIKVDGTVVSKTAVLDATGNATGKFKFFLPIDAQQVDIQLYNKWDFGVAGAVQLSKVLSQGVLQSSNEFEVTITGPGLAASGEVVTIQADGTLANLPALIAGQKYSLSETDEGGAFYTFSGMAEADTTNPLGLSETSTGSKVYTFVAPASNTGVGTHNIQVTNLHDTSGQITLSKGMLTGQAAFDSASDKMKFVLSGGNLAVGAEKTLELTVGGTGNFTGLTPGVTYTLTETEYPVGYQLNSITLGSASGAGANLVKTSDTVYQVTIPNQKDGKVVLSAVNEYDIAPDNKVKVKKVLADGEIGNPLDNEFEVIFTPQTQTIPNSFVVNTSPKVNTNVAPAADNSVVVNANNLIVGQTYLVSETAKTGYELVSIEGTGVVKNSSGQYLFTVPEDLSTNDLTITVTNKVSKGKVFFEKAISNVSTDLIAATDGNFVIEVWPKDGSYTDKDDYTMVYGSNGVEIANLFAGKSYYVRELSKTNYSFENMSAQTGASPITVSSPQPTLPATAGAGYTVYEFTAPDATVLSTTYTVNNKVDYLTDSLFVKKVLDGVDLKLTGTADQFELLLKGDNKPVAGELISLTEGQQVTLTNLLKGTTYTLEENTAGLDIGYLFENMAGTGISVTRHEETTPAGTQRIWYEFVTPTTPPAANSVGITVNNANRLLQNVVQVNKVVPLGTGETLIPGSTSIDVKIWRKGENKPTTNSMTGVAMNGTAQTLSQPLIAGQTYYIEEVLPSGYAFDSITMSTTTNTTPVALAKDSTGFYFVAPTDASDVIQITITNKMAPNTVVLKKNISNPDVSLLANDTDGFTFYIWPQSAGTTRPSDAKSFTLENGESLSITELHSVTDYYIQEAAKNYYEIEKVSKDATVLTPTGANGDLYAFTTADDGTITLEFVNQTQYATDTATVQKKFNGAILDNQTTFTVKVNGPNKTNELHNLVVNPSTGESQIVTLSNLLEGATYTIVEDVSTLNPGYLFDSVQGGTVSSDGSTVSFVADSTSTNNEIVFTNKNKIISPNVVFLQKTIANNEAPVNAGDVFGFAVYREGTSVSTATNIQVGANTNFTITGLIAGQKYYIVENATTGYLLNGISINNTPLSTDTSGRFYFMAPQDDLSGFTITVENRISRGEVLLSKQISNVSTHLLETTGKAFTFLIWEKGQNKSTAQTYVVNYPDMLRIDNLYGGKDYYIEEVTKPLYLLEGMSGVTSTSTAGVYEFKAPLEGEPSLGITVTNKVDYLNADMIGIKKDLQGVVLSDEDTFEVVLNGPNLDNEVVLVHADGTLVYPGKFLANTTYTIRENNPTNVGYLKGSIVADNLALTQTGNDSYSFTTPSSSSTTKTVISVQNKNKILADGTVKISKVIEKGHDLLEPNDTFAFTIWRAGTQMPMYPNITMIPDGRQYNVVNLIAGQKYYISEGSVEYYRQGGTKVNGVEILNDGVGNYFIAPTEDTQLMKIVVTNEVDYLPDGTIRIKPEMGYGNSEETAYRDKAGDNAEEFNFYIWRDGATKPVKPNYTARLNDNWGTPLEKVIANMKYYVDQESKEGYLVDGMYMNDMQGSHINNYLENAYVYDKPLQRDAKGYYFIAPPNADMNFMITSVNVNDEIPLGTFEIEAVMSAGQENNPPNQRAQVSTRYADNSSYEGKEEYSLKIGGESIEMRGMVAARRYYVQTQRIPGYHVESILYDGNEMDQDENGYYFSASSKGLHTMVTVVYAQGEEQSEFEVVLYTDGRQGGTNALPREKFDLTITGPDNLILRGTIDSVTGQTSWIDFPEVLPAGKYTVEEVLPENSNFYFQTMSTNVDGVEKNKNTFTKEEDTKSIQISIYHTTEKIVFSSLPNSGGIPMQLVAVIAGGLLLVLGAVLFLVEKKKSKKQEPKQ